MNPTLKDALQLLVLAGLFLIGLVFAGHIAAQDQARAALVPPEIVNNLTIVPGPVRLPGKE